MQIAVWSFNLAWLLIALHVTLLLLDFHIIVNIKWTVAVFSLVLDF